MSIGQFKMSIRNLLQANRSIRSEQTRIHIQNLSQSDLRICTIDCNGATVQRMHPNQGKQTFETGNLF